MGFDNRISLQKLEIFCLVVDLGGVGRAAERLYVSQPVVTAHMRMLQERIGAQLLHREGQKMVLTEVGEQVYEWATETLTRSREVARQIEGLAGGSGGAVAVASSMSVGSYILPPILAGFRRDRPDATLRLHVSDSEEAARAAESGECDFAVITSQSRAGSGLLRAERIGEHELLLVAAPDDERAGDEVSVRELGELPFVCSPGDRPRRRMVDGALRRLGVDERTIAIELGHPEALKTAVRSGLGVAMLLRASVAAELEAGTLREVPIAGEQLTVPIVVAQRQGKRFSPLQAELLDAVRVAVGLDSRAAISA